MKTAIAFGVLFAIIRIIMGFTVAPSHSTLIDVYKDTVHIFVGSLIPGAWQASGWQRALFWGMCAVEVAVAVLSRVF